MFERNLEITKPSLLWGAYLRREHEAFLKKKKKKKCHKLLSTILSLAQLQVHGLSFSFHSDFNLNTLEIDLCVEGGKTRGRVTSRPLILSRYAQCMLNGRRLATCECCMSKEPQCQHGRHCVSFIFKQIDFMWLLQNFIWGLGISPNFYNQPLYPSTSLHKFSFQPKWPTHCDLNKFWV